MAKARRPKKGLHRRIKHHLIPHKGNAYLPTIFTKESIAAIALTFLLIEGAYLIQTKIVMQNGGFTAAVLPTALTMLANGDRAANALAALDEDPLLARAAQAKADDMATKGYFAHVSPDGRTFREHLDEVGYKYSYAGENLAVDFQESVDVERAWMNSPTHRANLLKAEYTHVGYGVARGMYQGREVTFVAQYFATKRGTAAASAPAASAQAPAAAPARPAARPTPVETPIQETPAVAGESSDTRVLGSAAKTAQAGASMAVLATSPSKVVWHMVAAFTALIAVLFSLSVVMHIRNKYLYLEVLAGGVLILAIGIGILLYNGKDRGSVQIPLGSAPASQT